MGIYRNQSLSDSLQSTLSTDSLSDLLNPLDTGNPSKQTNRSALQENPERISASTQNPIAYSPTTTGVFTVGASGKVSFDFLFDGGMYQGEVAVFKLSGLEQFAPNSQDFIREAARRSLSNSTEGHVVISDPAESAQFSGKFDWESAYNLGRYTGDKTFGMNLGDRFALMLIPNGTVQEIFNSPSLGGAKRPLFSVSTSNPNNATHVVGLKNVNADGQVIGIEDLREDNGSDRDFNDIIFYMEGATGDVVSIDAVIKPEYSWRTTNVGQQLLSFTSPKEEDPIKPPPLEPIPIERPPGDDPNSWNAKFINFGNNTIPDRPDFGNAIASKTYARQGGKIRLFQDFGTESPDPQVKGDYFGMEAWTETSLEADKLYSIASKSDDGTQFFLKKKGSDEKKPIGEFGGWANGDWRDRSINEPGKTIYFKVPETDKYDFYVQYYDRTGNAAVDVTLEQAQPFSTEVDRSKKWQADVFWWDRTKGDKPTVKVDDPKNRIGTIDLGSNKPKNSVSGLEFNFEKAPPQDSRLPEDNFAIVAYTETTLDEGKYTFQASGDDGFQIFAENLDTKQKIAITPENEWQPISGSRSFSQELDKGRYKISISFYETLGDAKFDLSWKTQFAPTPIPIPVIKTPRVSIDDTYDAVDKNRIVIKGGDITVTGKVMNAQNLSFFLDGKKLETKQDLRNGESFTAILKIPDDAKPTANTTGGNNYKIKAVAINDKDQNAKDDGEQFVIGGDATQVMKYMYKELQNNRSSQEASVMKFLNSTPEFFKAVSSSLQALQGIPVLGATAQGIASTIGLASTGLSKLLSYWIWISKVQSGADWDHKSKDEIKPSINGVWTVDAQGSGREYEYEAWSNMHYGYIGRAANFDERELLTGAGIAQILTNSANAKGIDIEPLAVSIVDVMQEAIRQYQKNPSQPFGLENIILLFKLGNVVADTFDVVRDEYSYLTALIKGSNPDGTIVDPPSIDDPSDKASIEVGFDLFKRFSYSLGEEQFVNYLRGSDSKLHEVYPKSDFK